MNGDRKGCATVTHARRFLGQYANWRYPKSIATEKRNFTGRSSMKSIQLFFISPGTP